MTKKFFFITYETGKKDSIGLPVKEYVFDDKGYRIELCSKKMAEIYIKKNDIKKATIHSRMRAED